MSSVAWHEPEHTYRNPGVFGLETFTTSTSEYGPNARTPETKSSIESAGDALFLPKLTASSEPERNAALQLLSTEENDGMRARNRERTEVCP